MSNTGWIILVVILTIIVIFLLILWIIALQNASGCKCFGNYGVQSATDGNVLSTCGVNGNVPCLFSKNSLADCELECENLKAICNAFSFDSSRNLMKIVNSSNIFISPNANLYVRQ